MQFLLKFFLSASIACVMTSCGSRQESDSGFSRAATDSVADVPAVRTVRISVDDAKPASPMEQAGSIVFDDSVDEFIGIPCCIAVSGDTIFAIDGVKAPGFYAYRHDGSQIWAYSSKGLGPEDFVGLTTMQLTDSTVSAMDSGGGSIISLDHNGQFLRKTAVPFGVMSALLAPDGGCYLHFDNTSDRGMKLGWVAGGSDADHAVTVMTVPDGLDGLTSWGMETLQQLPDGAVIYQPGFDRTVYTLVDSVAYPRYEFDFGDLWWSDRRLSEVAQSPDFIRQIAEFPIQGKKIKENDRWLVVYFTVRKRMGYFHILDKQSGDRLTFVDEDKEYYGSAALSGDSLYLPRTDDTIGIIRLTDLF